MSDHKHVVRPTSDWDIPEPWEVVKVAAGGVEVVVDRTATLGEAEAKVAEKGAPE